MTDRQRKKTRVSSMLAVDFRRMFGTRFLYILMAICFVMPILILVMTTMVEGSAAVNPQTGVETQMEAFHNTWQILGALPGDGAGMDMSLTSMCNINLVYFFVAVLAGAFVAADFRSGYAKNLFTVRARKGSYVFSKTVLCFAGSALLFAAFFAGGLFGGAVAGLSFDTGGFGVHGIVMCMLAKILMAAVFVGIDLLMSCAAKEKSWLSIAGGLAASMLLFTMVPMVTPLNSGVLNVGMCLAGGVLFSIGLGAASCQVLDRTSLV